MTFTFNITHPAPKDSEIIGGDLCGKCGRYIAEDELPEDFGNGLDFCADCIEEANEAAALTQEP